MDVKQIISLAYPGASVLGAYIQKSNYKYNFDPSKMVFGQPQPEGIGTLVLTNVTLTGTLQNPAPVGTVELQYGKLDLATYFEGITTPLINTGLATDDQSILNAILDAYQIYFESVNTNPNDAYSRVSVALTVGGIPSVTITADPGNLIWQGSVLFGLQGNWGLLSIFPQGFLDQLAEFNPPLLAGQAYAETRYGTSFNVVGRETLLNGFVDGPVILNQDAGTPWILGQEMTGDPWIYDPNNDSPFNIASAVVSYNGPAVGAWQVQNNPSNYTNVLVITLGALCANLAGALIILFNPPSP